MSIPEEQKEALRKSLNAIADDVCQLVIREHQVMNDDFSRMAAILQEASRNLHECFGGMCSQLATRPEQPGYQGPVSVKDQLSAKEVDMLLSRVIRTLQFEDILQQMISHSRKRVEGIERLFVVLTTHINELNRRDGENYGKILETLNDCITDIDLVKHALGLENPVKYPSLDQGEIELF